MSHTYLIFLLVDDVVMNSVKTSLASVIIEI